jgi:hypothetical protein
VFDKIRMKIGHRISALGIFLAAVHLALALWVYSQHYEGSWGYIFFALPDLPVVLLVGIISHFFNL